MPDKSKNFTFWQARFSPGFRRKTLQDFLQEAFDGTTVRERLLSISEGGYFRFINYKTIYDGYFCANFFGYEKGRIGQIIGGSFDAEQIDLSQLPAPPAADGTEQQFLDGKLYFVCSGNQLILAQENQLQARHLEHYLSEMFTSSERVDLSDQRLTLERSVSLRIRRRIAGIKSIRFSAPLDYGSPPGELESFEDGRRRRSSRYIPLGAGWEALKSLLGPAFDLTDFETRGLVSPKEVKVSLLLSWRNKEQDRVSDELDRLANSLRFVDDEALEMEMESRIGKIKNDELRLSKKQNVRHVDDLPDSGDIFEKMIAWHEDLAENGHI